MTKENEDSGFVRNDRSVVPRLPIGYVWESVLAAGAMGVVHRVLHVALNRSVALKIITAAPRNISEYRERFHSEARALGKIDHPGIVQVFDYGDLDEIPFLVMEFCQGGNLGDLMVRRQVAPMHAAALVARLAEAIHHAHKAGIVHRDLKPANILIKYPVQSIDDLRPEDLRIADFGLAKHIWDSEWGITRSGQVVGTALYMAPEQIRSAEYNSLRNYCWSCSVSGTYISCRDPFA
jgi:serine/threonine-protein kinase